MIVAILQPSYLPWIGYFEQMYKSDYFVYYDDVQFDKHSWRNRNRIKTPQGPRWLTVPVISKFSARAAINEIRIDNTKNWKRKHLQSLITNYSKSPEFDRYIHIFENIFRMDWDFLCDLNYHAIEQMCNCIGLKPKVFKSSELNIEGGKIDRLISICKYFKADSFYEGSAGKEYIDRKVFEYHGINIQYQDYQHPNYTQLYGDFIPYLSIVDLLFNHGEKSLSILCNQQNKGD